MCIHYVIVVVEPNLLLQGPENWGGKECPILYPPPSPPPLFSPSLPFPFPSLLFLFLKMKLNTYYDTIRLLLP